MGDFQYNEQPKNVTASPANGTSTAYLHFTAMATWGYRQAELHKFQVACILFTAVAA